MNITKRKPTHPGKLFRETYIKPQGYTIAEVAEYLGISRKTLSRLVNEKQTLTPDVAMRIGFATSTTPESWFLMQEKLDMWNALQNSDKVKKEVKKIPITI